MLENLSKNQGNLIFAWQYESNGDLKFVEANGPRSKIRKHHFWSWRILRCKWIGVWNVE
jgi:hypothetical protein